MNDLFDKRTKKEKLKDFILSRNWTRTSDVIKWGTENYSNRADRDARDLCAAGLIKRMAEEEKHRLFGNTREDVWMPMGQ
jgi:hypothetical protein